MASIRTAPACDARILVAGVGGDESVGAAVIRAELLDIRYARFSTTDTPSIDHDLDGVDMLVIATADRGTIDREAMHAVAAIARGRGILVAAIVVAPDAHAAGETGELAAVREAVDMVMVIRDADAIPSILRALR